MDLFTGVQGCMGVVQVLLTRSCRATGGVKMTKEVEHTETTPTMAGTGSGTTYLTHVARPLNHLHVTHLQRQSVWLERAIELDMQTGMRRGEGSTSGWPWHAGRCRLGDIRAPTRYMINPQLPRLRYRSARNLAFGRLSTLSKKHSLLRRTFVCT